MRSLRDIDEAIADAIAVSNGSRPDKPCAIAILAEDEEERTAILARLRGKHNAKGVSVVLQHEVDAQHREAIAKGSRQ